MSQLDIQVFNPKMTDDMKNLALQSNFQNISNVIQRMGANSLFGKSVNTSQSITSSSYTPVTIFDSSGQIGFQTTGGLLRIMASFSTRVSGVNNTVGQMAMFLDGSQISTKTNFQGGAGSDSSGQGVLVFIYETSISPGAHNISFKGKNSGGGTLILNSADGGFEAPSSELYISEIVI